MIIYMSSLSNKTKLVLQVLVLKFLNYIGLQKSPFYYPVSSTLKKLGRSGCSELYSIERSFHGLILAETSYNERCRLYTKLTNSIKSCKAKYTSAKAFGWNPGLLEDWIDLFSQKDVLDYGCGYGGSSFFLGNIANSVTGVDSAEACISHCLQVKSEQLVENILFFQSSDLRIRFEKMKFDCIYSNDFLEHLHPDDARLHLAEAFRVLRPGGFYLCYTPGRGSGPHDITKAFYPQGFGFPACGSHLKEYTSRELIDLASSVGFIVEFPDKKADILALFRKG